MEKTQETIDHLKSHQTYPATKADLVASCDNLSDFSEADKTEFANKLEDKTYNSAEEVIQALGL